MLLTFFSHGKCPFLVGCSSARVQWTTFWWLVPTDSFYCAGRVRWCRQSPDCAGRLRIAQTPWESNLSIYHYVFSRGTIKHLLNQQRNKPCTKNKYKERFFFQEVRLFVLWWLIGSETQLLLEYCPYSLYQVSEYCSTKVHYYCKIQNSSIDTSNISPKND